MNEPLNETTYLNDIPKKQHKLPLTIMPQQPPPSRRTQSVAPLNCMASSEDLTETLNAEVYSLDLSVAQPHSEASSPENQQDLSETETQIIQLDELEVRLLNYVRLKKVSLLEVCEIIEKITESECTQDNDSNNNSAMEVNNSVCESVLNSVLALSDKNKTILNAFQNANKPKQIDDGNKSKHTALTSMSQGIQTDENPGLDTTQQMIQTVQSEVATGIKQQLLYTIKDVVNKQIDERMQQYLQSSYNNRKSAPKATQGPSAAKKSKTPQNQFRMFFAEEISQKLQETCDPNTQRMYTKQQQLPQPQQPQLQQPQQQPTQRSMPAQAVIGPTEEARPNIGPPQQQQMYVKNQTPRQHQQSTQDQGQEHQQGELSWGAGSGHQSHWPSDPRLRMRMMRSSQQQSAAASGVPNNLWAHSYCNGYGQGQY